LRETKLYLLDMFESAQKILDYTRSSTKKEFSQNSEKVDAVVRNLEIIGEAANKIPQVIRHGYPEIDWQGIIGMRNVIIHEYFGVDLDIIWKTIRDRLPELTRHLRKILETMK
jgi:uncharacterized protein with HEPN domain